MNFVWIYGKEAHPEEHPFAPGFETIDLGWTHRYFETTTMEQRAERARWMKSELEPDAEMPMMMDYINSELGEDNAIRAVYGGGGFYSGFVIDCDGTIIYQSPWGWFRPGGQWWTLPLPPAADLEAFLDEYLADPPPCYEADPPLDGRGIVAEAETSRHGRLGAPTILIVDDDEGRAYEGYFEIPLGNLQTHSQIWDVQAGGSPPLETLHEFRAVVWLTGDSTVDTLTETDQDNLAAYLDAGGKLFISGQNIGQDIGDSAFYHDYLHASLIDEEVDAFELTGDDILAEWEVRLLGPDGAGNQSSPARIEPLDGAVGVFHYAELGPEAWAGLRWEGEYQVVYFAFGFEGIGNMGAAAFRFKIMKAIFEWFDALPCAADFDQNGQVGAADLLFLLWAWGSPDGDVDGDGDTDTADLLELLGSWGECP
ncbi:MAG: hypothetical protein SYC29_02820 [Planctomycetota bacterium]|nr:hypothetical protein [Planctomycetota bacterium]